uniref:STAS domain-containing protein n=1 Tax=Elaeophora elaphi TaxID=1147741 RepID=A0A0R3S4B8_9BILA
MSGQSLGKVVQHSEVILSHIMAGCQYAIDILPAYAPQLIASLIALVEFIIVIIAYIAREIERKKTFYGREDFEDIPEEEKMEHEGAIMGKNTEELRIVQSTDRTAEIDVGTVTPTNASGVKVMVRRKKAISEHTDSLTKGVVSPFANVKIIRFTLEIDWTARGFEFISVLEKALQEVEEFKHIQIKLTDEAQNRLCDFFVRKMRAILEESTQRRWLVYAVIQNKIWKVSGLENLLEKGGGDIRTQQMLRITAQGPFSPIIIFAYMIEIDVKLEQMKIQSSPTPFMISKKSRSKIRDESPTQSISRTYEKTPQTKQKFPPISTPLSDTNTISKCLCIEPNYLTTLHTMSTMPSEKLPTVVDSRSSRKDTGLNPTSTKQKRTLSMPYNRRGSLGQMRKYSSATATNRWKTLSDTDVRARFRSYRGSEKVSTEYTQTE